MKLPEYKIVTLDGEPAAKVQCPGCGTWAFIDHDQWCGGVSIDCEVCPYHETHNFAVLTGLGE